MRVLWITYFLFFVPFSLEVGVTVLEESSFFMFISSSGKIILPQNYVNINLEKEQEFFINGYYLINFSGWLKEACYCWMLILLIGQKNTCYFPSIFQVHLIQIYNKHFNCRSLHIPFSNSPLLFSQSISLNVKGSLPRPLELFKGQRSMVNLIIYVCISVIF